jgi:hypothetical protein
VAERAPASSSPPPLPVRLLAEQRLQRIATRLSSAHSRDRPLMGRAAAGSRRRLASSTEARPCPHPLWKHAQTRPRRCPPAPARVAHARAGGPEPRSVDADPAPPHRRSSQRLCQLLHQLPCEVVAPALDRARAGQRAGLRRKSSRARIVLHCTEGGPPPPASSSSLTAELREARTRQPRVTYAASTTRA